MVEKVEINNIIDLNGKNNSFLFNPYNHNEEFSDEGQKLNYGQIRNKFQCYINDLKDKLDKIINKNIEENDENLQDIVKKLKISLAKPSAFHEKIIQPGILQIVHNSKNEILKKFVNEIYKPKLNIDLGGTKYDIFLDLNNKYDKEEFNSIENLDYDQKLCKLKENFKDDIQDLLGKLGNINDRTEQNDKKLQDIIENQLIKSLDKQNNFCEIKRNIIIDLFSS